MEGSQMKRRAERELELQGMVESESGIQQIIELWQKTVIGFGVMGTAGKSVSQMIPEILDKEFPPRYVEILKAASKGVKTEIGTAVFRFGRVDGKHDGECKPAGMLSDKQLQKISDSLQNNEVRGEVDEFEWRT